MGLVGYSEEELRELLDRAVRLRWPGEDLIMLTWCQGPSVAGLSNVSPEPTETSQAHSAGADAVLGVTRSRLIYQERLTYSLVLRVISTILGLSAVVSLFVGGGLISFAIIGGSALFLWTAAKLAELLTVGETSIEFHRVSFVDRLAQRIDGTCPSGTAFRVRIPDPSDFSIILSLLDSYGQAVA
ncbi:MAG: hypothetical protein E6G44_01075 [Actinobacteria bacterium]|nr:MAG: hypothetical protein E6G44_01075 [Actinomycetota bacterium]